MTRRRNLGGSAGSSKRVRRSRGWTRAKSSGNPILVALAVVVFTIAICLVVLVPFAWIFVELWALSVRRPANGFRLTDDEVGVASVALGDWSAACEEIGRIEAKATRSGCHTRADGRWDERLRAAVDLNRQMEQAMNSRMCAEADREAALAGPSVRFEAWATPHRYAWALRTVVIAWGVAWFAWPEASAQLVAVLANGDGIAAFVGAGFASLPLLLIGAIAGAVGYGIGAAITARHAPSDRSTLLVDAMRERKDALASVQGSSDVGDATEGSMTAVARVMVMILKYVAITDGRFTDEERRMIRSLVVSALEDHDAGISEVVEPLLVSVVPEAEAVREHCTRLRKALDENGRRGLLLMACRVSDLEGGAADVRLREVATNLGFGLRDVEAAARRAAAMKYPEPDSSEKEEDRTYACLVAVPLKWIVLADGNLGDRERQQIKEIAEAALGGGKPGALEYVDWSLDAIEPDEKLVAGMMEGIAEDSSEFRKALFTMACVVAESSQGNGRAARLDALARMLRLDKAAVETCREAARVIT